MTDREILRPLAYAYAQASQSSQNDRRRLLHRKVNDLEMERPVVLINELPWNQLNFDGSLTLRCQDPLFRGAEDFFRKKLFQWTHFPGDMILTPYFPVMKRFTRTGIGIQVEEAVLEEDKGNNIVAHEYHDQLETEEQLEKIRLPVLSYQEEATWEDFQRLGEVFGDLLPVRITGHNSYFPMWDNISQYRGVTPLLIDLAERPEFTHRIIRKFTDIELSVSEQMEKLGLFEPKPHREPLHLRPEQHPPRGERRRPHKAQPGLGTGYGADLLLGLRRHA